MKKLVNFKLIISSFLIVVSTNAFSENPVFKEGEGKDSTIAGIENDAKGEQSTAIGKLNKA